MKIIFQIKEMRTVKDTSYDAKAGATVEEYVTTSEIQAEVKDEVAKKVAESVHRILSEEI